jgi:hypothetical protein
MNSAQKPSIFKRLLERKAAQNAGGRLGVIGDNDLLRKFSPGAKPQPIIRRGGRNGSGKP